MQNKQQDLKNRRSHAWEFPTVKTDFKLGNLLERRGFEKLDQEASDDFDEEPNSSMLLTSAQFA